MKPLDPTHDVEAREAARGLLHTYAPRLAGLAHQALSSVVRWEWAHRESEWEGPDPVRRQVYPSLPEPRGDAGRRYGFDAGGVLRVAESVERAADGDWIPWCRSIWVWDEGVGSLELYSLIEEDGAVQRLRRVALPDVSGGRMVGLATCFDDGRSWIQRFEYDASGQVIRRFEFWDPAPAYQGPRARYDYAYDDAGLVLEEMVALDAHGDELPEREVTFRRALPDAVRAAQRRVASELPSRVRAWAERAGAQADSYCVILGYDVVNHALPPTLALGRRSDRPSGGFERDDEIWSGPDFATFAVDPEEFASDAVFMDLSLFFPAPNSVNSALFDNFEDQLIEARNRGLVIILTLWKYPPWMNGLANTSSGGYQQGSKSAAQRLPDDVSTTSVWASMILCLLTAYSTGSTTPRKAGAAIDVLEICNEPNGMCWPQSTSSGIRTAGCQVGQMMQTALIISSWFGNQATAIAGPGATDVRYGSANGLDDANPALVTHTDVVVFAQDVVASFTSAGFVPGTRAVFTTHNHHDIAGQHLNVAVVREQALRGHWAGWPYANVNDPHIWITEGGVTPSMLAAVGIAPPDYQFARSLLIAAAWGRLDNNSTAQTTQGGAGVDLFTHYLFETDPGYDCGLVSSSATGPRVAQPSYYTWKSL